MVKHTKKFLVQSLKILFSAGIIFWLIQSGKLNFIALKNLLSPGTALLATTLVLLSLFFASERWRILIQSQKLSAGAFSILKLSFIGNFFNFAMPGGVGGDVVKAYYFTKDQPGSKVIAVTSVLMDRVLGLFAMVLLALIAMTYDFQHIVNTSALLTLFWFILSLFIGFVVGLSLVFSDLVYKHGTLKRFIQKLPLSRQLLKLYESMHLYGKDGRRFIQVILLSLASQICSILFLYMAGTVAGFTDISAKTYFLVAPIGFMVTAIPLSPAGVGVGQAAFYFLFNLYNGKPSEVGPTAITAFQVCTFLTSLLGAFFYLRRKDRIESVRIEEAT
ncbi:MAG: lysylphosphatidylglycerol synthase transmembrane domain-containing protein [Pseudobdellovibrionaceae bacterium]